MVVVAYNELKQEFNSELLDLDQILTAMSLEGLNKKKRLSFYISLYRRVIGKNNVNFFVKVERLCLRFLLIFSQSSVTTDFHMQLLKKIEDHCPQFYLSLQGKKVKNVSLALAWLTLVTHCGVDITLQRLLSTLVENTSQSPTPSGLLLRTLSSSSAFKIVNDLLEYIVKQIEELLFGEKLFL